MITGAGGPIVVEGRLWGVAVTGSPNAGAFPAGTERRIADFTELVATAIANAETQAQLIESRARLVTAADQSRQRIERDLHDGAQQRLVSLVLQLRMAHAAVPPQLGQLGADLELITAGLTDALDELRDYARGIHPAILTEGGLGFALKALACRCPMSVDLDIRAEERLPGPTEMVAYYVLSEALTNAAKHANAAQAAVSVEAVADAVRISVCGDGRGWPGFTRGTGLAGLKDRVRGALRPHVPPQPAWYGNHASRRTPAHQCPCCRLERPADGGLTGTATTLPASQAHEQSLVTLSRRAADQERQLLAENGGISGR